MELTLKQYNIIRIITVILLSVMFSQAIIFRNFWIPMILLVVGSLFLMLLRKNVKGVLVDERDYATGGKAALLAMQIWSFIAVVIMFALLTLSDKSPVYQAVAMTLSFSVCAFMLLYSVIYRYYNRISILDKRLILAAFVLAIFIAIFVVGALRSFSGEDNWICQNGQWVSHGHPDSSVPTQECK
jgi:uncharacterized membrane protein